MQNGGWYLVPVFCKWRGKTLQNGGFLLEKLSIQYCYVIKVYNLLQVRSEKTLKLSESHFNVVFAVRNLPKIEHIPKQGLFLLIQTTALKMVVFANGRVLARLKICHFQGFAVMVSFHEIFDEICLFHYSEFYDVIQFLL